MDRPRLDVLCRDTEAQAKWDRGSGTRRGCGPGRHRGIWQRKRKFKPWLKCFSIMEKFRVSWTPDLSFCSELLGCPLSCHVFQFLLSNNHALLNMFIWILSKMDTSANIPYISHSSPAAAPHSQWLTFYIVHSPMLTRSRATKKNQLRTALQYEIIHTTIRCENRVSRLLSRT